MCLICFAHHDLSLLAEQNFTSSAHIKSSLGSALVVASLQSNHAFASAQLLHSEFTAILLSGTRAQKWTTEFRVSVALFEKKTKIRLGKKPWEFNLRHVRSRKWFESLRRYSSAPRDRWLERGPLREHHKSGQRAKICTKQTVKKMKISVPLIRLRNRCSMFSSPMLACVALLCRNALPSYDSLG